MTPAHENINYDGVGELAALRRRQKEDPIFNAVFGKLRFTRSTEEILREVDEELWGD